MFCGRQRHIIDCQHVYCLVSIHYESVPMFPVFTSHASLGRYSSCVRFLYYIYFLNETVIGKCDLPYKGQKLKCVSPIADGGGNISVLPQHQQTLCSKDRLPEVRLFSLFRQIFSRKNLIDAPVYTGCVSANLSSFRYVLIFILPSVVVLLCQ